MEESTKTYKHMVKESYKFHSAKYVLQEVKLYHPTLHGLLQCFHLLFLPFFTFSKQFLPAAYHKILLTSQHDLRVAKLEVFPRSFFKVTHSSHTVLHIQHLLKINKARNNQLTKMLKFHGRTKFCSLKCTCAALHH